MYRPWWAAAAGRVCGPRPSPTFYSPSRDPADEREPLVLNLGGAKVCQHGQHAAVTVLALGQLEFH
jgi:hypothetical protein